VVHQRGSTTASSGLVCWKFFWWHCWEPTFLWHRSHCRRIQALAILIYRKSLSIAFCHYLRYRQAFGSLAILWGIILLLFLPNNVSTARRFTPSEKDFIERRIGNSSTGIIESESDGWNMKEALLCFLDPKSWLFILIVFLGQVPNGGLQTFSNLILTSAGFSNFLSSLIGIPHWFIAFVVVLGTGYLASTFNNITTLLISFVTLPPLTGYLMMLFGTNKYFSLAGYLVGAFGHAVIPLTMSLIAGNIRSVTQKMTMTALIFITISLSNM